VADAVIREQARDVAIILAEPLDLPISGLNPL
jgi:hypothetical protein